MFNNTIYLKGILSPYFFSHESNNKRYLQSSLLCIRDNQPYNIPIKFREDMLQINNIDIGKEITTVGTIRTYNKKLYVHTNLCNVNWENEHNNLDCEIYGKVVKANEKFKFYIVECDSTVFIPVRQAEDIQVGQECHIVGYLAERQYTKKNDNTTKSTYEVIV